MCFNWEVFWLSKRNIIIIIIIIIIISYYYYYISYFIYLFIFSPQNFYLNWANPSYLDHDILFHHIDVFNFKLQSNYFRECLSNFLFTVKIRNIVQ